jgi:hypothetical protein
LLKKTLLLSVITLIVIQTAAAQLKIQQGMFLKQGTNIRLGSIQVTNKRSSIETQSSIYGEFQIPANSGDTLLFSNPGFLSTIMIVSDLQDKIIYMQPIIELSEVNVKANSVKKDLMETQKVYRSKGVFYTGDPHYYYLFLKPMTFIYENFKSEVKNARKFKKYTKRELEYYEISKRYNDSIILKNTPISKDELVAFKMMFMPTYKQYIQYNDYDLIKYIKASYQDFKKVKKDYTDPF